jgi:hypothetical protein
VPLLLAARQADVDWVSDFTGRFIEANFGMSALEGRHISNKAAAMGAYAADCFWPQNEPASREKLW